jgi:hypothetical protein
VDPLHAGLREFTCVYERCNTMQARAASGCSMSAEQHQQFCLQLAVSIERNPEAAAYGACHNTTV